MGTVGGVVSGDLNLPVKSRQSIMSPSLGPLRSMYEGHGLTKPLPCLLWCAFPATSDGEAERVLGEETTAEVSADIMAEDLR